MRAAAASTAVPGRLQVVDGEPLTVFDGAHNPDAVAALVESLPEFSRAGRSALVLGVLEDKDAAGMLAALLPLCERAWFTAPPSSRALSPAALQSLARQLGFERGGVRAARRGGRSRRPGAGPASTRGRGARDRLGLPRRRSARRRLDGSAEDGRAGRRARASGSQPAMNDEGPSVLTMIGAVALIVALVILVFFAAGYGFGRLFL